MEVNDEGGRAKKSIGAAGTALRRAGDAALPRDTVWNEGRESVPACPLPKKCTRLFLIGRKEQVVRQSRL